MLDNLSSKLGLTIDLSAKTWRTADGRSGATEPFGVSSDGGFSADKSVRAARRRRHDERR